MAECLIIETSDSENWPSTWFSSRLRELPSNRRPTILQPDRKTADAEAMRLARQHPGKVFAVFEARAVARCVEVPQHVTLGGEVVGRSMMPVLSDIDPSERPF